MQWAYRVKMAHSRCEYFALALLSARFDVKSFMYGGSNDLDWGGSETPESAASIKSLDEVFVLSLPAFRWFKANYVANYPRIRHKCEIVGNRQMLSIGGLDPRVQVDGKDKDDPCPQGLGIFDLSEMVWKTDTGYDADAPPYTTPEVVQAWYRDKYGFS